MEDKMFNELLESVKQAGAIVRGEMKPSRVTVYPDIDVRSIRKKTGLSQDKFSILIGVSVGTFRNWEQGRRRPTGAAVSLLKIFDVDPKHAMKALAH